MIERLNARIATALSGAPLSRSMLTEAQRLHAGHVSLRAGPSFQIGHRIAYFQVGLERSRQHLRRKRRHPLVREAGLHEAAAPGCGGGRRDVRRGRAATHQREAGLIPGQSFAPDMSG